MSDDKRPIVKIDNYLIYAAIIMLGLYVQCGASSISDAIRSSRQTIDCHCR